LLKNIEEFNYESKYFWTPELYLVNALNAREEISYKVRVVPKKKNFFTSKVDIDLKNPSAFVDHLTCLVTETRKIRGVFHETMELHEFPTDRQELSVKISSLKPVNEVVILEDMTKDNIINIDRFCDENSWDLFEFCKFSSRKVEDEFKGITRSEASFSSFVVRKYKYYLYK
jgi:hypothetical protein